MEYLPAEFCARMKEMLQDEYPDFINSYEEARQYGLRVNTLKVTPAEFAKSAPFHLRPIPWVENGYYYEACDAPSRHPYYAAGLYYLQEPSAMTPASQLPVNPGDRVLDLCAAPGGKATELGARLQGQGLLVANDISNSRAKALLHNIELCGIANAFITNETPFKLAGSFFEYFDKILVDAPCSGEGMFRKDIATAKAWDADKPAMCATMQREILGNAWKMLKPGGMLLYSTCTFAPEENEQMIDWLLTKYPQMQLLPLKMYEGFSQGNPEWGNDNEELRKCIRIWPHRMKGEGHFLALLQKQAPVTPKDSDNHQQKKKRERSRRKQEPGSKAVMEAFFEDVLRDFSWDQVDIRGDKVYLVPPLPDDLKGLRFLRNGLFLGEIKKNRFEPGQPFAMALKSTEYKSVLNLSKEDERVQRYLKGETILVEPGECTTPKGWQLVCVENFSLGWGKLVNGVLKNKYLCSWRKK